MQRLGHEARLLNADDGRFLEGRVAAMAESPGTGTGMANGHKETTGHRQRLAGTAGPIGEVSLNSRSVN